MKRLKCIAKLVTSTIWSSNEWYIIISISYMPSAFYISLLGVAKYSPNFNIMSSYSVSINEIHRTSKAIFFYFGKISQFLWIYWHWLQLLSYIKLNCFEGYPGAIFLFVDTFPAKINLLFYYIRVCHKTFNNVRMNSSCTLVIMALTFFPCC